MMDCAKEMLGFHDDEVTLPEPERRDMRERRNANRNRLKNGLKKDGKPGPQEFVTQGSYAMRTMVQRTAKDYDIDDGVYFAQEVLTGPHGGEMSALAARQMVCNALNDGSFKTPPEVRLNCVRVYYDAGYHVDIPIYRCVVTTNIFGQQTAHCELASNVWKRSDARDVTQWFDEENQRQSPDTTNGRQLRRVTRLLKRFAKSRPSWEKLILSGFGITKLVTECYYADAAREDRAVYYTMRAMRDRLNRALVVWHPVTPNDTITTGNDDAKARFLREKLSDALGWLDVLFAPDCTREAALKAWDKVFSTTYFSDQVVRTERQTTVTNPVVLTAGLLKNLGTSVTAQAAVRKEGGGRYA